MKRGESRRKEGEVRERGERGECDNGAAKKGGRGAVRREVEVKEREVKERGKK